MSGPSTDSAHKPRFTNDSLLVYQPRFANAERTRIKAIVRFKDERLVEMEAGLPIADMTPAGFVSSDDMRRYATREALVRLHQHRFRAAVLRAYATRWAVCRLREAALLQAAHIVEDREPQGRQRLLTGPLRARCTILPTTGT